MTWPGRRVGPSGPTCPSPRPLVAWGRPPGQLARRIVGSAGSAAKAFLGMMRGANVGKTVVRVGPEA